MMLSQERDIFMRLNVQNEKIEKPFKWGNVFVDIKQTCYG